MPITHLFGNAQDAARAAAELQEYGFEEHDIHVVSPSSDITAAMRQAGVQSHDAQHLAERVQAGDTLLVVHAPFGAGLLASRILGDHSPIVPDATEPHGVSYGGTEINDPAPLSHALGLRLLLDDPAPLSRLLGLKVLTQGRASASAAAGMPELSSDPAPLSHALKLPVLSGRAAPLSDATHMPVLSGNPAPLSDAVKMRVLTDEAAPLSKRLGWKTLSEEPAPLSKLLGLPVLLRQDR